MMESSVAVSIRIRETNWLSLCIAIEWRLVDWFLVSLSIVAAAILSLILQLE
jgi:hypothetical protein